MFKTSMLLLVVACASLQAADGVIQNSAEIAAVLSKATANGGMKAAPVSIADQHRINVINRVSPERPSRTLATRNCTMSSMALERW